MEVESFDIKIRAFDGDYQMGDDLKLTLPPETTIHELAEKVKEIKGIPISRMLFVLPPNRELKKWEKNLRQSGVYNNGVVRLHPTRENIWEWEKIEYYWNQVIERTMELIDPKDGTALTELVQKVEMPRSMRRVSLVQFLRKYPDIFQIEMDTTSHQQAIVYLNKKKMAMPTWT